MKLVIGLTGNIGAGKTVVSEHLHKKYKADQVRFSRILMDVLDRLYLPKDRKNLQTLGVVVRDSFGGNVIVNAFKKDMEKSKSHVVVVDGIRYVN
jgi:dephospho-CoA kinase